MQLIDAETFKTFILADIKRIFHGEELARLNNSIAMYKQRLANQDERVREVVNENFDLRLKTNQMLAEREATSHQMDSLRRQLQEAEYHVEVHNYRRLNAENDRNQLEVKL